jgi:DNA-directed RNA polymerase subunit RPC12/RpoP
MIAKTSCQHCGIHIEFEAEQAGGMVVCPGCNRETALRIDKQTHKAQPPRGRPLSPMTVCADCGHPISRRALMCPSCGSSPGVQFRFVWDVMCNAALVSFIFTLIGSLIFGVVEVFRYLAK